MLGRTQSLRFVSSTVIEFRRCQVLNTLYGPLQISVPKGPKESSTFRMNPVTARAAPGIIRSLTVRDRLVARSWEDALLFPLSTSCHRDINIQAIQV